MSIGSRMPGRRSGTRLDWLFLFCNFQLRTLYHRIIFMNSLQSKCILQPKSKLCKHVVGIFYAFSHHIASYQENLILSMHACNLPSIANC
jgi:hypothetical protein